MDPVAGPNPTTPPPSNAVGAVGGGAAVPPNVAMPPPSVQGPSTNVPTVTPPNPTDGMPGPAAPTPAAGITYHKDIRPIIEANCVECHSGVKEFLIAPMALHDWASVKPYGTLIVDYVTSGKMPPWPASNECRDIADNRSLPMEVKQKFVEWQANAFAEGNEAEYVAPMPRRQAELGEPDLILQMTQQYMPRIQDEYTCFGLSDPTTGRPYSFPETKNMIAVQVLPGTPTIVHHVQLWRQTGAPPAGPGCTNTGENMFSWRPGSTPLVYPTGDAAVITQGSGFTVQMHYNNQSAEAMGVYKPDQTKVAFWFMNEGTPKNIIRRVGIQAGVSIPPGQKDVRSGSSYRVPAGSSVVGVTPHAHQLATSMSATIAAGGSQPACLVDVPKWDFHWQLDYMLAEPIPGPASIATTCVWDNTAANQPTVNGMKIQPRFVSFGEASLDEMCLHYIWVSTPAR